MKKYLLCWVCVAGFMSSCHQAEKQAPESSPEVTTPVTTTPVVFGPVSDSLELNASSV